jgi:hypothetical protein
LRREKSKTNNAVTICMTGNKIASIIIIMITTTTTVSGNSAFKTAVYEFGDF